MIVISMFIISFASIAMIYIISRGKSDQAAATVARTVAMRRATICTYECIYI